MQSVSEVSAHLQHKLLHCIHMKRHKTAAFSCQTQVNAALLPSSLITSLDVVSLLQKSMHS